MKFKKKTLKNGLRIVTHSMPSTNTVTITVFVKTGSDYEKINEHGLSHFLEHMCFKGTTKIPKSRDIALNFEKYGSNVNAFTDRRYTCYYVDIHI